MTPSRNTRRIYFPVYPRVAAAYSILPAIARQVQVMRKCCPCSFHQLFSRVQRLNGSLARLRHGGHLLGLESANCLGWNARAHRPGRLLVLLTRLLVCRRIKGDKKD